MTRSNARYCSNACKVSEYKARTGYHVVGRRKRRLTRNGKGVRIYITEKQAAALVSGVVPAAVAEKCKAKLKPADPIPGQLDLITALEDHDGPARQPQT